MNRKPPSAPAIKTRIAGLASESHTLGNKNDVFQNLANAAKPSDLISPGTSPHLATFQPDNYWVKV